MDSGNSDQSTRADPLTQSSNQANDITMHANDVDRTPRTGPSSIAIGKRPAQAHTAVNYGPKHSSKQVNNLIYANQLEH